MKKSLPYVILILVVAAGVALWQYSRDSGPEDEVKPSSSQTQSKQSLPVDSTPVSDTAAAIVPAGVETTAPVPSTEDQVSGGVDTQVFEIVYDGESFSPNSQTIRQGDIVIFQNQSGSKMWPASAPHPTHTAYPEFDSQKGIAPGAEWQFKFEKVGAWKFHDHLNPSAFGVISVEQ